MGNVTFFDAINIIHDTIITVHPYPYTAQFVSVDVRNYKDQQTRHWR